ncbi:MAG: mechanosensitive ion channel domain-containing protein [Planctomycetota bacterium]
MQLWFRRGLESVLVLASLVAFARAQEPSNGPGSTGPAAAEAQAPETVPTAAESLLQEDLDDALPTLDSVRARLAALDASDADSDATERKRLREIEGLLTEARDLRAKATQVRQEAAEAPQRVELLQAELDQPQETGDPPVPADATLDDLRQKRDDAEGRVETLREEAENQKTLEDDRAGERSALSSELSAAQQRLDEAERRWIAAQSSTEPATELRLQELAAEVDAARAEVDGHLAQREFLTAMDPLDTLQRARLERELQQAEQAEEYWADLVAAREQADSDAAARQVEQEAEALVDRFPTLAEYQRQTAVFIQRQRDSGRREEERLLDATQRLERDLSARADRTRAKVAISGLTEGIGLLLRGEYDYLLALEPEVRGTRNLRDKNSRDQIALELAKDELADLLRTEQTVDMLLLESGIDDPQRQEAFRTEARLAVASRKEALEDLRDTLRAVTLLELDHLLALESVEQTFDDYFAFVAGEILWVPSTVSGRWFDLSDLRDAALWLADVERWQRAGRTLLSRARAELLQVVAALLLVVLGASFRGRLRRQVRALGERVRSFRTDAFNLTLRALVLNLLIALPLPLAMWLVGDLGRDTATESLLLEALAAGLRRMAPVAFALVLVRTLAMSGGVGEVHFRWPAKACVLIRKHVAALESVVLPTGVLFQLFDAQPKVAYNDTLGRIAFVIAMGALLVFAWRVMHPERGVLAVAFARTPDTLLYRTRKGWFSAALTLPAAHLLLALAAYYYTAQQLELRLEASLALALALVVVNGLLQRWLFITRRKLAVEQARKRAQDRRDTEAEERVSEAGIRIVDEDEVDIPALDLQTRRLFRSGITLSALVGLYLIWASALPALGGLARVQVWPSLAIIESERYRLDGDLRAALELEQVAASADEATSDGGSVAPTDTTRTAPSTTGSPLTPTAMLPPTAPAAEDDGASLTDAVVTLADVALAAIILLVVSIAARNIPALLEISLLQRLPMDSGSRFAVSTLVRYVILVAGASSAFGALGVGWEKVQWLAAALTFGLAFGLQEIFANFVSGIIILLERPVRIGDIVTVGNTEGTVTRLRMRATTIMDWDRRELLVPNKEFITGSIVNWTLSDPVTRIHLNVGVAYGSDTERARELLIAVARDCEYILDDPTPKAWFMGFGDSTLDLRLLCFISTRDVYFTALNQLHSETDRRFKEAGLEIAFPQRDLHLRSAPGLEGLTTPEGSLGKPGPRSPGSGEPDPDR